MTTRPEELDETEIVAAVVLALITAARRWERPVVVTSPPRTPTGHRAPALTWSHRRPRYGVGHA